MEMEIVATWEITEILLFGKCASIIVYAHLIE